jgi:hypothetical protein
MTHSPDRTSMLLVFTSASTLKACSDVLAGGVRGQFKVDRTYGGGRPGAAAAAAAAASAAAASASGAAAAAAANGSGAGAQLSASTSSAQRMITLSR